jgi:hypothetical protein
MFNQMQLTILRIVMENVLQDFKKEQPADKTSNMIWNMEIIIKKLAMLINNASYDEIVEGF